MADSDRENRIKELSRLVKTGEYEVDPHEVASALVEEELANPFPTVRAKAQAAATSSTSPQSPEIQTPDPSSNAKP
jgi:hypothetical protein